MDTSSFLGKKWRCYFSIFRCRRFRGFVLLHIQRPKRKYHCALFSVTTKKCNRKKICYNHAVKQTSTKAGKKDLWDWGSPGLGTIWVERLFYCFFNNLSLVWASLTPILYSKSFFFFFFEIIKLDNWYICLISDFIGLYVELPQSPANLKWALQCLKHFSYSFLV